MLLAKLKKRQEIEKNLTYHKNNLDSVKQVFSFQKVITSQKDFKNQNTANNNEEDLKKKLKIF